MMGIELGDATSVRPIVCLRVACAVTALLCFTFFNTSLGNGRASAAEAAPGYRSAPVVVSLLPPPQAAAPAPSLMPVVEISYTPVTPVAAAPITPPAAPVALVAEAPKPATELAVATVLRAKPSISIALPETINPQAVASLESEIRQVTGRDPDSFVWPSSIDTVQSLVVMSPPGEGSGPGASLEDSLRPPKAFHSLLTSAKQKTETPDAAGVGAPLMIGATLATLWVG